MTQKRFDEGPAGDRYNGGQRPEFTFSGLAVNAIPPGSRAEERFREQFGFLPSACAPGWRPGDPPGRAA